MIGRVLSEDEVARIKQTLPETIEERINRVDPERDIRKWMINVCNKIDALQLLSKELMRQNSIMMLAFADMSMKSRDSSIDLEFLGPEFLRIVNDTIAKLKPESSKEE